MHTSQHALYKVQGGPPTCVDTSPDHQRSAAIAITLLNADVCEALSWASPDTNSVIAVRQIASGFVTEEHSAPLMSCPTLISLASGQTSLPMRWSKGYAYC